MVSGQLHARVALPAPPPPAVKKPVPIRKLGGPHNPSELFQKQNCEPLPGFKPHVIQHLT
jgi:hypothetical protein